jgi:hypothetical protein
MTNRSMKNASATTRPAPLAAGLAALVLLLLTSPGCGIVRAPLPTIAEVPMTEAMPIDGVWRLEENGKRYHIEGGRSWLMESHTVGPIRYQPGSVHARDIVQTDARTYHGEDLATVGPLTITVEDDRLDLVVATLVGPVYYTMHPVELDHPQWFSAQLASEEIVPRPGSAPRIIGSAPAPGAASLAGVDPAKPLSAAQRAGFGRYHALVIGNDAYQHLPKLETANTDARAVSELLSRRYGFEVKRLRDATRAEILTALRAYRTSLTESDNLLIYYAGHGWLDEEADEGYWLPVDAQEDSDVHWISNATITGYLRSIKAKHVMIVADSCYSGTLTRGIALSVKAPDYLERLARERARVVLSSGGLEPVADGGGGGHSAFARHFIDTLRDNPNVLDSTTLYAKIRRPVMLAADQEPELADIRKAGHEGGDFLFVPVAP